MSYKPFFDRFMAATRTGDKATLLELVHPEFELIEPSGLPYEGVYRGVDGWRKLARAVVEAWEDFKVEPIAFPGESNDTFTVHLRLSGRSRKTGLPFSMSVLELWRFRDGRLIRAAPALFLTPISWRRSTHRDSDRPPPRLHNPQTRTPPTQLILQANGTNDRLSGPQGRNALKTND